MAKSAIFKSFITIFFLFLKYQNVKGVYSFVDKEKEDYDPIFYKYSNKSFGEFTISSENTYENEFVCMKTCFKNRCKAIDLKRVETKVSCVFYDIHQELKEFTGQQHITITKPVTSRYCENVEDLCGICQCIDTVASARPYICDCRKYQVELQHYRVDCSETVVSPFKKSGFYTIRPDGNEKIDVMCEINEDDANEVVFLRAAGSTVPQETENYVEGFGWSNEFWLGFNKMKKLTDYHDYTLVVDFWTVDSTNFMAEHRGFRVTDAALGKIEYDTFKEVKNSMYPYIPTVSEHFRKCTSSGFWWYTCDKNIFNTNIIWPPNELRNVKFFLRRQKAIQLLSQGKPSTGSSLYTADYPASLAFDGDYNNIFHSARENEPWIKVDLESIYTIDYVTIYNRRTSYKRLQNGKIQVSKSSFDEGVFKTCATFKEIINSPYVESFPCPYKLMGKYVRLIIGPLFEINPIDHGARFLNIHEMEVYGWQ